MAAFNPFHWFRKHQKAMLAALAIFCMFIFVLQFGRGDPIERFLGVLGMRTQKDQTPVIKLYGKTVTITDLRGQGEGLMYQREFAQDFLFTAMQHGQRAFLEETTPTFNKLEEPAGGKVRQVLGNYRRRMENPTLTVSEVRAETQQDLRVLLTVRQDLLKEKEPKIETAKLIRKLCQVLENELWRLDRAKGNTYFGGSFDVDGLLDFMVWLHQADQLGIHLTDEAIREQLKADCLAEILVGDTQKDNGKIGEFFPRKYQNMNLPQLYQALGNEFRVRLAQEAMLGQALGVRAYQSTGLTNGEAPSLATPEEFWSYYVRNRTEIEVALLTVPVSRFVDKVKGEPTPEEMQELFNKYKEVEPVPDREKPALKVPRQIKVEWISAAPDAAYYQKESAAVAPIMDRLTQALAGTVPIPMGSGGFVPAATYLFTSLGFDLRLTAEYEGYVHAARSWLNDSPPIDENSPSLYERFYGRLAKFSTAGNLVAQVLAVAGTRGPFIQIPGAVQGRGSGQQVDLVIRAARAVLASTSPTGPGLMAGEAAALTRPLLSMQVLRPYLAEQGSRRYAPELVLNRLLRFKKDLEGRNSKEAPGFVTNQAVLAEGITQHGATPQARTRFDITEAPGLEPLYQAYEKQVRSIRDSGQKPPSFDSLFFHDNPQVYRPEFLWEEEVQQALQQFLKMTGGRIRITREDEERYRQSHFAAQMHKGEIPFLYWKTEDKRAYVPTFAEAKPMIVAPWRLQKARDLARQEAEAIAAAVRNRKEGITAERFLREEAARRGYEVVLPPGKMARLVSAMSFLAGGEDYKPYQFPDSQIAFPKPDTVENLLQNLHKPGDATVVSDRPEKHIYVAALISREEPSKEKFYILNEKTPRGALVLRDLLWVRFLAEQQSQFRKDLLRQLRSEAAALDDQGNFVIDINVRNQIDRRESE